MGDLTPDGLAGNLTLQKTPVLGVPDPNCIGERLRPVFGVAFKDGSPEALCLVMISLGFGVPSGPCAPKEITQKMDHPNIVRLFAVYEEW